MPRVLYSWIALCALQALTAEVAKAQCDPELLAVAASVDGYKAVTGTEYCEGFINEPNAGEIQILYFERKGLVTPATRWLRIEPIFRGSTSLDVRGTSILLGVPYRFTATLRDGHYIDVDLDKLINKRNVPIDAVGFIALQGSDSVLEPIVVRDKDGPLQPVKPVIGVRLPSSTTKVQYRFDTGDNTAPWKSYVQSVGSYGVSEFVVDETDTAMVVKLQIVATLNGGNVARLSQSLKVKP